MKVAVLGGGFQGVCTALELAARGVEVDLYDKNEQPITQAGFINEGRIHLGFNYANDPTLRTADLMSRGALSFRKYMNRWIDFDREVEDCSDSVLYAVHRDSLVSTERVRSYFEQVCKLTVERLHAGGGDYLGADDESDFLFEELEVEEWEEVFDPRFVTAAFRTLERSVPVASIAERLRERVDYSTKIRFWQRSQVAGVRRDRGRFLVNITGDNGRVSAEPDQVVNALWDGRLVIDAELDYAPKRSWLHRFKYGVTLVSVDRSGLVPSIALACGPFGGIVRYRNGDLYLSWYPACLKAMSGELSPPDLPLSPNTAAARQIFDDTWKALAEICPPLGRLGPVDESRVLVRGGDIFAWGQSDIDDVSSELHGRADVGIFSDDGYHSINTGKYTLAPMFAVEVADRVCGGPRAQHRRSPSWQPDTEA